MSARAISRILLSAAVIAPETDLKCCKRSDLPLYTKEKKQEDSVVPTKYHVEKPGTPGAIEECIRTIRLNINSVFNEIHKYEDMTKSYIKEGTDSAQWLVDYLGDEENQAPKAPAIGIGGLAGFILGLRGGFFKKVIYTSVGALSMAAVCYPKEAKEYGGIVLQEGEKYATIAYNFAYGVKKGDQPLELPTMPKIPSSLTEVMTMVSEFVSSTSASITDKTHKLTTSGMADETKKVSKDGPCKWIEGQKDSGAYRRIILAEEMRERREAGEDLSGLDERNRQYYKGDDSCPCHKGSCMHSSSKEDCPDEIPYPPPNPPKPPLQPECECGTCCPLQQETSMD